MKTIELLNPKTGVRRKVKVNGVSGENRFNALTRAGFVPAENYRAPKVRVEEPEPSLADEVEGQSEAEVEEVEAVKAAEEATHAEPEVEAEPEAEVEAEPEAEVEAEEKPKKRPSLRKKKSEDK